MSVIKYKATGLFCTLPNSTAQDKRLSAEARGVLLFMASLPDDWDFYKEWLQKQFPKMGRDKLTRVMKELQEFGYLTKTPKRLEDGTVKGFDWEVRVMPKELEEGISSLSTESTVQLKNRRPVKPSDGKPAATKEILNTKETSNKRSIVELGTQHHPVIEHLNSILGSRYQKNAKSNAGVINARLAEGHTVEDLNRVVDFKFKEWGGDPAMAQYLRPSTLFSTKNFNGYLVASNVTPVAQLKPTQFKQSAIEQLEEKIANFNFNDDEGMQA